MGDRAWISDEIAGSISRLCLRLDVEVRCLGILASAATERAKTMKTKILPLSPDLSRPAGGRAMSNRGFHRCPTQLRVTSTSPCGPELLRNPFASRDVDDRIPCIRVTGQEGTLTVALGHRAVHLCVTNAHGATTLRHPIARLTCQRRWDALNRWRQTIICPEHTRKGLTSGRLLSVVVTLHRRYPRAELPSNSSHPSLRHLQSRS
jgi:hypothetical protein